MTSLKAYVEASYSERLTISILHWEEELCDCNIDTDMAALQLCFLPRYRQLPPPDGEGRGRRDNYSIKYCLSCGGSLFEKPSDQSLSVKISSGRKAPSN